MLTFYRLEWEGRVLSFPAFIPLKPTVRLSWDQAVIWIAELSEVGLVGQVYSCTLRSDRRELADGETSAYIYGFRSTACLSKQGHWDPAARNSQRKTFGPAGLP
jgi:hypothetical protein